MACEGCKRRRALIKAYVKGALDMTKKTTEVLRTTADIEAEAAFLKLQEGVSSEKPVDETEGIVQPANTFRVFYRTSLDNDSHSTLVDADTVGDAHAKVRGFFADRPGTVVVIDKTKHVATN